MARDMTKAQFVAALKRNGLRIVLVWIWRRDPTPEQANMGVPLIMDRKGNIYRRQSIAYALKRFREADAQKAKSRKEAA